MESDEVENHNRSVKNSNLSILDQDDGTVDSSSVTDEVTARNGDIHHSGKFFTTTKYGVDKSKFTDSDFSPSQSSTTTTSTSSNTCSSPIVQTVQTPLMTAAEYANEVRNWMWQYHCWNTMNCLYRTMPFHAIAAQQNFNLTNSSPVITGISNYDRSTNSVGRIAVQPQNDQHNQAEAMQGVEYRVPPIWKRVIAELIDFVLLLLIKIGVAFMLIDITGGLGRELQPIDVEQILVDGEIDIDRLLNMTSELMVIEVVNRVFISLFEAMCLRHGIHVIGGSTPGKRVMGLCVVSCVQTTDLPDNRVLVVPAQNIGFWNALKRSVVKNFSMAFLFPICVTALFFQNGQAAYDLLANCIVVEDNARAQQR